jgi:WD40 repeat protein
MSRALALLLSLSALPPALRAADELPPRALARIGDYRFYHGPGIRCAILSPDGRRIASAADYPSYLRHVTDKQRQDYNRVILLWDAATGERLREVEVPRGPVVALAFSPDGKRLAASCFGPDDKPLVLLIDAASGKPLRQLEEFDGPGPHMQFSADGKRLLVSERDNAVSSWEVETGKRVKRWTAPAGPSEWLKEREVVLAGVPSPDGKLIAWQIGTYPDYSNVPPGDIPPPAFPHPEVLVVSDAATDKPLYRKAMGGRRLEVFAFTADGKRFVTGRGKFTVWESATGKELFALNAGDAWQFALSPDGKRAVIAGGWSNVRLWDLETRKPAHDLYPGFVYVASDTLTSPQVFSADGKTLLLATDTTLRLFDTTTGKERAVPGHRAPVSVQFSASGRTLCTACNEAGCSWDLSGGKEPALLSREPRAGPDRSDDSFVLCRSDDGRFLVEHTDRGAVLREADTRRVVRRLTDERFIYVGRFSPDGARVLLWHEPLDGKSEFIRIYDTKAGKPLGDVALRDPLIRQWALTPDGRLIGWADRANDIHLHDAATGKLVRTLHSARPLPRPGCDDARFFFSPDGEHLIVTTYEGHWIASDKKPHAQPTRVFRVADGREVARFYCNPEKTSDSGLISCAACSPDGRLLAVAEAESGTVRLVEIASGRVRAVFTGHRHGVRDLAFSPGGKTLASGGEDNVVYLWDVTGTRTGAAPKDPTDKDIAAWWDELAGDDAPQAGAAAAALIRSPDPSVAYLARRLRPVAAADEKSLARLIRALDGDEFEQREAAGRELARLGAGAEAALRRGLRDKPSEETKRRIESLLDALDGGPPAPEVLRGVRALEALEHIGTAEARKLLESLAAGAPDARLTREAKGALGRLDRAK